ncbi:MAG: hypothetical protein HRT45_13825 [Bdellovibrionales bacterium]|nr:hypothetical protein [Bdellovibrionales bacterium]
MARLVFVFSVKPMLEGEASVDKLTQIEYVHAAFLAVVGVFWVAIVNQVYDQPNVQQVQIVFILFFGLLFGGVTSSMASYKAAIDYIAVMLTGITTVFALSPQGSWLIILPGVLMGWDWYWLR